MLDYGLSLSPASETLQQYADKFSAGKQLYEKGLCELFQQAAAQRASLSQKNADMQGFGLEFEVMCLLQTEAALEAALHDPDLPDFSKAGKGPAKFLLQPVSVQEQKKAIGDGLEMIDAKLQCIGLAKVFHYADESYKWHDGRRPPTPWMAKSFQASSKKTGDETINTTKIDYALFMSGYYKLSDNANPEGLCGLRDLALVWAFKKPDFHI